MRRDVLRERLVDAARAEFVASGWSGATTKSIARRAGISEGLIYRRFRSKEQLFEAAVLHPLENAGSTILRLGAQMRELNDEERRRAAVTINAEFMAEIVNVAPLLHAALARDREWAQRFYRQRVQPLLDQITARGSDVMAGWASEDEARLLATMMLGTYYWLAQDAMLGGTKLDPHQTAPLFAEFFMRAVQNPRADEPAPSLSGEGLLSDELWSRLEPRLPAMRSRTGRDHRIVLSGVSWKFRTGCSWRQMPDRFGPWQTIWKRTVQWAHNGTWDRLIAAAERSPRTVDDLAWMHWARDAHRADDGE
jgi:AcrR family transcriptional regulator